MTGFEIRGDLCIAVKARINLNLSNHGRLICGGKYDDRSLQNKKIINVLFVLI